MGLSEKRKIKELQDVTLAELVKEIEDICVAAIPYDVNWHSFAGDIEGLNFMGNLSCHRPNMALRVICRDDMGKETVRDTITKVKRKNVKTKPEMAISFAGGTLEMHCAHSLHTDGMHSDWEIGEMLVKKL